MRPLTIHEPTTMATDLALGTLTLVFATYLFRQAEGPQALAVRLWGGAFVCSAGAAILGGLFHGFGPAMSESARASLWKASLLVGGATGFFLVASAARATLPPGPQRVLLVLAGAKLVGYLGWVAGHPSFKWLVYDYGSAMLATAVLHGMRALTSPPAPGAWWIVAGVAASLVAALVQRSGLTLHRYFNHNDLFHVLQMGATTLLYRGGSLLRE